MTLWSPWKKLPITLPDQNPQAQAVGYAWALYKYAELYLDQILERMPVQVRSQARLLQYPLARMFRSTHQRGRFTGQDELAFGRGAACTFVRCPYIQTNNLDLFQDQYSQGFVEGYRFCFFACATGLLELLYVLPMRYWWALAIHFAWERMAPGEVPLLGTASMPMDELLEQALKILRYLYQCYLQVSEGRQ
ncbi:hypothetical protein [Ktedonobacter robiniae]|uniref:Uncharacterized protein n=1 Tax=Ktedonobacter robiniae TaxID=2778365 RepID=A0ABQ3V700_9CHLR|nr:hypothetical protein [Ktedonobacter robiniae]GHO60833.1 hypothetical protein KSB_93080 [Ktedonobacter robiniae]